MTLIFVPGWCASKHANPTRSACLCASLVDFAPIATPHSLFVPNLLLPAQYASRGKCNNVRIAFIPVLTESRGWRNRRAWRYPPSPSPSDFRTTRTSWPVLDRRWPDDVPLGRTRRGPSARRRCVRPSELRRAPWRKGQLAHTFCLFLHRTDIQADIDYPAGARQSLLRAHQRDRPEDPRDASWSLLPPPLYRQGRRRATSPLVGSQRADTRPRRRSAKLPAVHFNAERKG